MSLKVVVGSRSRSRSKEAMEILEKNGYILELNPFDRTMTEDELIERIKGASALVAGSDKDKTCFRSGKSNIKDSS